MTKEQLRKFIKDTRGLIRGAPVDKKIKLLSLLKEAKRRCEDAELTKMKLNRVKVKESLDSKFASVVLAGKLEMSNTIHDSEVPADSPNSSKNTDYLEEK